jgi:hypothetical protein
MLRSDSIEFGKRLARLSTHKNTPELPRHHAARPGGASLDFNPSTSKLARQNAVDLSIMDPETTRIVQRFHHTPLPQERSIRLLHINRDILDSISITLDTFPLDGLPRYEALSYTWGKAVLEENEVENNDLGIYQTITVNCLPFTINENLHDMLYELRNELQGYLWVDALCIDQMSNEEKPSQVILMGDIYTFATGAIGWLGKEIPEVGAVLWLSVHYLRACELHVPDNMIVSHLNLSLTEWARLWGAHRNFYRRYRWFRRAWVSSVSIKIIYPCLD